MTFVTYLGGSGASDIVHGIALDFSGNIYAAGTTGSADFPATAPFAHTGVGADGNSGAFLVKLDPAGAHAAYSAVLGGTAPIAGSAFSGATAVAVDSLGSAYIAGFTTATNFPTAFAAQPHLAGNTDGFLAKVDTTGSQLVYSTYLGGSGNEQIYGLAVDSALRPYVVGETLSVDFPTTTADGGLSRDLQRIAGAIRGGSVPDFERDAIRQSHDPRRLRRRIRDAVRPRRQSQLFDLSKWE